MTRSRIAEQFNISPETLRYYENLGLLSPERNGNNSYREYSEHEVILLDLIIRFKNFGFSLKEIQHLFSLIQKGEHDKTHLHKFLDDKLSYIDEQITGLESVKKSLLSFKSKEDIKTCTVFSQLLNRP